MRKSKNSTPKPARIVYLCLLVYAGAVTDASAQSAGCAPVPEGLVSWWQAESNAFDSVGSNNGYLGNVSFAPGKVGNAFLFNDMFDELSMPDAPNLNPTNSLSLECWVYLTAFPVASFAPVAEKGNRQDVNTAYRLLIASAAGQWHFTASVWTGTLNPFSAGGGTVVQTDTWYHVAMTYDGATIRLYVNGQLDGSAAAGGPMNVSSSALLVGSEGSGYYFEGLLDELSLYDRALSATEVQELYQAGSAGKCARFLRMSRTPGNLSLSWPLSAGDSTLQSIGGGLSGSNVWEDSTVTLHTNGGKIQATLPTPGNAEFFRLRQQ